MDIEIHILTMSVNRTQMLIAGQAYVMTLAEPIPWSVVVNPTDLPIAKIEAIKAAAIKFAAEAGHIVQITDKVTLYGGPAAI